MRVLETVKHMIFCHSFLNPMGWILPLSSANGRATCWSKTPYTGGRLQTLLNGAHDKINRAYFYKVYLRLGCASDMRANDNKELQPFLLQRTSKQLTVKLKYIIVSTQQSKNFERRRTLCTEDMWGRTSEESW